jgi:DME family drug/metabolite transporter
VGGLLQGAIAVPALRTARSALRARLGTVLLGSVSVAIYPLAFYSSMQLAGVAVGSVVSLASAPVASRLLERVVDRRAVGRRGMLAAALGMIGGVMLCLAQFDGRPAAAADTAWGILLGLVAGTTYAVYSWVARRLMDDGVSRAASMGAVFGLGGLLLIPVLVVTGAPLVASAQAFAVAGYMALVPMFLGYLLFGIGLARVSASTATTITIAEPAVATLLAVVVVGERLTGLGWAGLAVIGVVLVLLALPAAGSVRAPRRSTTG